MLKTQVSKFVMKTYTIINREKTSQNQITSRILFTYSFSVSTLHSYQLLWLTTGTESLESPSLSDLVGDGSTELEKSLGGSDPSFPSFPTPQSLFQETLLHTTIFSQNPQRQISHWQSRTLKICVPSFKVGTIIKWLSLCRKKPKKSGYASKN